MKKITLALLFAIGCLTLNAQQKYDDDDDRKRGFRFGVGLSYGSEVEEFGLHLNAEFFLSRGVSLSPEFNYFFLDDRHSFWTFNIDGHYYFSGSQAASLYGLLGLNFANYVHDHRNDNFDGKGDDTDSSVGLNLGIGANFHINARVVPFAQFKFVASEFDQAVLTFGIRF